MEIDQTQFSSSYFFFFFFMSKHVWRVQKEKSFTFEKANDLVFYLNNGKKYFSPGLPLLPETQSPPHRAGQKVCWGLCSFGNIVMQHKHHGQMPARRCCWLPSNTEPKMQTLF